MFLGWGASGQRPAPAEEGPEIAGVDPGIGLENFAVADTGPETAGGTGSALAARAVLGTGWKTAVVPGTGKGTADLGIVPEKTADAGTLAIRIGAGPKTGSDSPAGYRGFVGIESR